jgi:hypothetical protein
VRREESEECEECEGCKECEECEKLCIVRYDMQDQCLPVVALFISVILSVFLSIFLSYSCSHLQLLNRIRAVDADFRDGLRRYRGHRGLRLRAGLRYTSPLLVTVAPNPVRAFASRHPLHPWYLQW